MRGGGLRGAAEGHAGRKDLGVLLGADGVRPDVPFRSRKKNPDFTRLDPDDGG